MYYNFYLFVMKNHKHILLIKIQSKIHNLWMKIPLYNHQPWSYLIFVKADNFLEYNLQHFALLVGLVYKAVTVLTHHKQRQGVDKLSFAQRHDRHRYHTKNK